MKKIFFISFLFLLFGSVQAQDTISISISKPYPRVGEIVRLSFDMDFFTNFIHSGFEDSAGIETRTLSSYEGRFERKISFTEEKEYTFGPYAFSFNGKAYVTN